MSDLREQLRDVRISLAIKGRMDGYLPPEDWEEVRRRLQAVYRRATGEQHAVLSVENAP